jgi:hypothetical protein
MNIKNFIITPRRVRSSESYFIAAAELLLADDSRRSYRTIAVDNCCFDADRAADVCLALSC